MSDIPQRPEELRTDFSQVPPVSSPVIDASLYYGLDEEGEDAVTSVSPSEGEDEGFPEGAGAWAAVQGTWQRYNRYEIVVKREISTGLKGMRVAGKKTARGAKIVRTHAPYCKLTIAWLAERFGAKPQMPHSDFGDPNYVLEWEEIIPESPVLLQDNESYKYRVSGVYIYVATFAPGDQDSLIVPTTAAVTTPASQHTIYPGDFDRNLLRGVLTTGRGASLQPITF